MDAERLALACCLPCFALSGLRKWKGRVLRPRPVSTVALVGSFLAVDALRRDAMRKKTVRTGQIYSSNVVRGIYA
jgi:hypothetical protein